MHVLCLHHVKISVKNKDWIVSFFVTMYHKLVSQELQNSIDTELAVISIDFCIILL